MPAGRLATFAVCVAIVVAFEATSCGGHVGQAPPTPLPTQARPVPLHTSDLTALVSSSSLTWMLDVSLSKVRASPWLNSLWTAASHDSDLAEAELRAGTAAATFDEIVYATYEGTTLFLARGPFDAPAVEKAFTEHADAIEGRAIDRGLTTVGSGEPLEAVTRVWGAAKGQREQLALLGSTAIGIEKGYFGPLRVAELFAEQRLHRATPVLTLPALSEAVGILGEAPIRLFFPGPFRGETGDRLGGLLRAATAVAVSIAPGLASPGIHLRLVVLGEWGGRADEAQTHLVATFNTWSHDILGRAAGLDHPLSGPVASQVASAVIVEAEFDGSVIEAAIRRLTSATTRDLFGTAKNPAIQRPFEDIH